MQVKKFKLKTMMHQKEYLYAKGKQVTSEYLFYLFLTDVCICNYLLA